MKEFYFNEFEDRRPYSPVKSNRSRNILFHTLAILLLMMGVIYFHWRWFYTLNFKAPIFSLTLVTAETVSFICICFSMFELWKNGEEEIKSPPHYLSDVEGDLKEPDRPISIDVFITTINEEAALLLYTIRDAKAMRYPYADVPITIYLLDDGRRDGRDETKENLKELCESEGIVYLSREDNIGFKAGNLKNGVDNSSGDFFIILDADARPFPGFLENVTGYFRDPKMAWVQTCHWFYDTTRQLPVSEYLNTTFKINSPSLKKISHKLFGSLKTGDDIYGSDPRQFYEVILRRRNNHNASFCCGAGSIHRRVAVVNSAQKEHQKEVNAALRKICRKNRIKNEAEKEALRESLAASIQVTPFKYHISEDLYTSMIIHSDEYRWKSMLHPYVECKMLSPQDIDSFVKQRSRYAEGSIDIGLRDNPMFKKGLNFGQRICYLQSILSYFSCLWLLVFLFCPIISFFTDLVPLAVPTEEFFVYFIPFYLLNQVTDTVSAWGVSRKRGKQYYIALFWINLKSIFKVISGGKINFNVTPKSKQKTHPLKYVWPHIIIISLTLTGMLYNAFLIANGASDKLTLFLINVGWGINNCIALGTYVRAAFWNIESTSGIPDQEGSDNSLSSTETMGTQILR